MPMLEKIRRCVSIVLDRRGADRGLTVFPDDVLIVSYPRSGNTWFRFLIANLLSTDPASFGNIERIVPDIYTNSDVQLLGMPRPRILKSHEPFTPLYRSVVYLIRDPRDVAVSLFHYNVKVRALEPDFPLDRFIDQFIDSASEVNRFGTWGEHVRTWIAAERTPEHFVIIRYEDLLADAPSQLRRICNVLGIPGDDARIQRAVQLSDAQQMRASEKEHHDRWASTKGSRKDKQFVRKAKEGSWREELPPQLADCIARRWPDLMERFGYA